MLTCKIGGETIYSYKCHSKEQLKKWSDKNILKCKDCGQTVELCWGVVRKPYFRHKDKCLCETPYYEPETDEHVTGKEHLFEWLRKQPNISNVELEAWIPETKQRPDISFDYSGQKYVIEYQCSPISTEYAERHDLYQAAGIKDIWILGIEKYFNFGRRGKFIEEYADAYYYPQYRIIINNWGKDFIFRENRDLSEISDDLKLKINMDSNLDLHCETMFYLSGFTFVNGSLHHRSIVDYSKDKINKKRILRKYIKEDEPNYHPNKYLNIYQNGDDGYIYNFCEKILNIKTDSWVFEPSYKGLTIKVTPLIYDSLLGNFVYMKETTSKIKITYSKLKKCVKNKELFKEVLTQGMKQSIDKIKELNNEYATIVGDHLYE